MRGTAPCPGSRGTTGRLQDLTAQVYRCTMGCFDSLDSGQSSLRTDRVALVEPWPWRMACSRRHRSRGARRSSGCWPIGSVERAELALEADRLVIASRRTYVAQRQPVFDERGSSVSLTGMECDRVLADRAAERFRVHSAAPNRRPVIHWRGLGNPPCLLPGA